jgi:hypothetical protein
MSDDAKPSAAPLREIETIIAAADADQGRSREAETTAATEQAERGRLWAALDAVRRFEWPGDADAAVKEWSRLFLAAGEQLNQLGLQGWLATLLYDGTDSVFKAGNRAAFQVYQLACAGDGQGVETALRSVIASGAIAPGAFRRFLFDVRDQALRWTAGGPQPANPEVVAGYPLVCNRLLPAGHPIEGAGYTQDQIGLARRGFRPHWWLPLPLVRRWKTHQYPLHETAESVAEWRRWHENLAKNTLVAYPGADGIRKEEEHLAWLANDLALLRDYNPALVPDDARPHGSGPNNPAGERGRPQDTDPPMAKSKRSTIRGEARAKISAALTLHHRYADGNCLNENPISVSKLAKTSQVGKGSVSRFFTKEFGGHSKYRNVYCRDLRFLTAALKKLNGEYTVDQLFGGSPPQKNKPHKGKGEED